MFTDKAWAEVPHRQLPVKGSVGARDSGVRQSMAWRGHPTLCLWFQCFLFVDRFHTFCFFRVSLWLLTIGRYIHKGRQVGTYTYFLNSYVGGWSEELSDKNKTTSLANIMMDALRKQKFKNQASYPDFQVYRNDAICHVDIVLLLEMEIVLNIFFLFVPKQQEILNTILAVCVVITREPPNISVRPISRVMRVPSRSFLTEW